MLAVEDLEVVYSAAVLGLRGTSVQVQRGAVVALLGANGAGKTTLLRACTGLLGYHNARVTGGDILLDGRSIKRSSATAIVRGGVAQAMEGRRIFGDLTVEENLRVGGVSVRDRSAKRATQERVFDLFPVLGERRRSQAGYLSGGEQQMLAIGRALMANPDLILFDEISLGLAPVIIGTIYEALPGIIAEGMTALLVEQDISRALSVSSRVYCLQEGRVSLEGRTDQVSRDEITAAYFGVAA